MNGFKDDVLSILRDNVFLHKEALGLVVFGNEIPEARELLEDLEERKFPVAGKTEKLVVLFDYIVLHRDAVNLPSMLQAINDLSNGGIIILDVSDEPENYENSYISHFGNFSISKVKYDTRAYLILHPGVDYAN